MLFRSLSSSSPHWEGGGGCGCVALSCWLGLNHNMTLGATHHQTPRASRNGPAFQEQVHHCDEGNAGELMPRIAALWLGESALLCKSHAVVLYQLMAIQVVMSMQRNHVANPAGAPEQGKKQQSPGSMRGGSKTDFKSCLLQESQGSRDVRVLSS